PGDRRAATVPFGDVANAVGRNGDLLEAELVALVEDRCASKRQQYAKSTPHLLFIAVAHPRPEAHDVVIRECPDRPCALREERFCAFGDLLQLVERRKEERKVESHVELATLAVERHEL